MIVLGILSIFSWVQATANECPVGTFGDLCEYSCHCGSSCGRTSGVCVGDCDRGWVKGSDLCQKENVALGKSASTTSGIWGDWGSSPKRWSPAGAVDGNIKDLNDYETCFHAVTAPSDWTVDLGQEYQLYDIRIYIRKQFQSRIADSIIYLDGEESKPCYHFPSTVSDNPADVTCNGTARNLTILNPGNSTIHEVISDVLNICEVEIYVCSSGTYGVECSEFCHCSGCDRITGKCSDACSPGWQGERCDTECSAGSYSTGCARSCSSRQCLTSSDLCHHVTGNCASGCTQGWMGQDCTQRCSADIYGVNCMTKCIDRKCKAALSTCDIVTGECPDGCQNGWTGIDCYTACPVGTYGKECLNCSSRHCSGDQTCHPDGICAQGCQSGWTLNSCTQACDREYYGTNCTGVCATRHCEGGSSCNLTTGVCSRGCQTGWAGEDCTVPQIEASPTAIAAGTATIAVVIIPETSSTAIVAGTVTIVVVIILITGGVVVIWKKRRCMHFCRSHASPDAFYASNTTPEDVQSDSDLVCNNDCTVLLSDLTSSKK